MESRFGGSDSSEEMSRLDQLHKAPEVADPLNSCDIFQLGIILVQRLDEVRKNQSRSGVCPSKERIPYSKTEN